MSAKKSGVERVKFKTVAHSVLNPIYLSTPSVRSYC